MKLLPILIVVTIAFFCSFVRDRLFPAPTPSSAANLSTPAAEPSPVSSNVVEKSTNTPSNSIKGKNIRTISGGVLNGRAETLPQPAFPAAAKAVHAEGSVSVQVLVDENGKVVSAKAVSGHPLLHAAAEQAAWQAKFSPTLLGGESVKVSGVIVYSFTP